MFEQLELDLRMPWEGRSPRVLTKAFRARSLVREGMGRLDLDASHVGEISQEVQLQLPLFPFEKGVDHG